MMSFRRKNSASSADAAPRAVPDSPLLVARDVWKSFGGTHVIRGADLTIDSGEVVVLLGRSGSGKTTLLRCIAHLELVDAGLILLDGELLGYKLKEGLLTPLTEREMTVRRRGVGVVFQHFHLFPHMTVLENVTFAPMSTHQLPRTSAVELAHTLLARVGLTDKLNAYPSRLSGGQQQRVAIARALATQPRLMLFDEPTSALDPELVRDVLDVIRSLADDGMTMLIVTHELGFAREVADKIAFMQEGEIVEVAASRAFFTSPESRAARAYLSQHLNAA